MALGFIRENGGEKRGKGGKGGRGGGEEKGKREREKERGKGRKERRAREGRKREGEREKEKGGRAGRMVLRLFIESHGTLVAVSAPIVMPIRTFQ
jgi:hypothetical protein